MILRSVMLLSQSRITLDNVAGVIIITLEDMSEWMRNDIDNETIDPRLAEIYIENIDYDSTDEVWVKTIVTALPMSLSQAGDNYGNVSDIIEEIRIIENYVLTNQSVNLLLLKEDYQDEDVNNIWQQATIDSLGRDHEVIKKVRLKNAGDILDIINDTLSRLGMFQ